MIALNPFPLIAENLRTTHALEKYSFIMNNIQNRDISIDKELQTRFNGFYIVRRNAEWRQTFYSQFESYKTATPTFNEILTNLYHTTGRCEASFASKLLASLCPDMPIWDSHVLNYLGLKRKALNKDAKLEEATYLYSQIVAWYKDNIQSDIYKPYIDEFDLVFPEYSWLTPTKKLDFIIWGNGRILQ